MSLTNIVNQAKRLKRGLEDEVSDGVDLNGGSAPSPAIVPKVPAPVNEGVIHAKPAQKPTQADQAARGLDRQIPGKGSRTAPKRDSTLDAGDGRSRRARGRNSRVSTNVLPEHCDAFKIGCDERGVDYCIVLEAMIQREFPELVAEFKEKYDQMYGRRR